MFYHLHVFLILFMLGTNYLQPEYVEQNNGVTFYAHKEDASVSQLLV
jgi:hypothetical protein